MQTVLTTVRTLEHAGGATATRASFSRTAKAFTGPMFMGIPKVDYGGIPILPALPGLGMRFYSYDGNGKWTDATNGKWIVGELGATR